MRARWVWVVAAAVALMIICNLVVEAGVAWGRASVPPGQGLPPEGEMAPDLFRFDSYYYLDIAREGYRYNGDPGSSPNIVFAPLYPLLVESLSTLTRTQEVDTGFWLNRVLLFGALLLLIDYLQNIFSFTTAFGAMLALVTAAGSYSLSAFYSESTTLFFFALALWGWWKERWFVAGAATAFLGASRLAAFPLVAVFSAMILQRAWLARREPLKALRWLVAAGLCWAGFGAYWIFLDANFGDPYPLLNEIQTTSWGLYHREVTWASVADGAYLFSYLQEAFERGLAWWDIKTLNLVWLLLGLSSAVWALARKPGWIVSWLTAAYVVFIYWSSISSDFLISVHRFMILVPAIFLMFADLHGVLAKRSRVLAWVVTLALLTVNAGFGVFHAACFNQGVWYYF